MTSQKGVLAIDRFSGFSYVTWQRMPRWADLSTRSGERKCTKTQALSALRRSVVKFGAHLFINAIDTNDDLFERCLTCGQGSHTTLECKSRKQRPKIILSSETEFYIDVDK